MTLNCHTKLTDLYDILGSLKISWDVSCFENNHNFLVLYTFNAVEICDGEVI